MRTRGLNDCDRCVPDEYAVLVCQGGGSLQFASIPLNLTSIEDRPAFVVTGNWSQKAYEEASKYCSPLLLESAANDGFRGIPFDSLQPSSMNDSLSDSSVPYLYFCDNETVYGVEFPEVLAVPDSFQGYLVVDMSSNLFTRPVDVRKYGLIYACAQKNFGASGVTLVIGKFRLLVQILLSMHIIRLVVHGLSIPILYP